MGGALASLAAPALAQTGHPEIRWRVASSYPRSLTGIFSAMEMVAKRVGELTGGKFNITVHPAGELVPPLGVLDAVQKGTVEAATAPATSTSARTRPSASTPPCPSAWACGPRTPGSTRAAARP
jgi:TRAP-type mannitol/chloroaromatic compound transport system substrate-binding protein